MTLPLGLFFGYTYYMAMSITVKPKRGRPATGRDPLMAFRAPPELRKAIEAWCKRQPEKPSRSEAIRQLIEEGLKKSEKKPKK